METPRECQKQIVNNPTGLRAWTDDGRGILMPLKNPRGSHERRDAKFIDPYGPFGASKPRITGRADKEHRAIVVTTGGLFRRELFREGLSLSKEQIVIVDLDCTPKMTVTIEPSGVYRKR